MSNFFIFQKNKVTELRNKYPKKTYKEIIHEISELWKSMSKEEKEDWTKLSELDRERYHKEMNEANKDKPKLFYSTGKLSVF